MIYWRLFQNILYPIPTYLQRNFYPLSSLYNEIPSHIYISQVFSSNLPIFGQNIILSIKSWNVIHDNSKWIIVNDFVKIIWEISQYNTLSRICCENRSTEPRSCYEKKYKMPDMISTTFYWRGWLDLVEIVVDQEASLLPRSLIGGDDGFNG